MSLTDELLTLLHTNEEGLTDEQISNHFGPRYTDLVLVINELLATNRLQLFTQANALVYKVVREETAAKFDGLGPEQIMVYQIIERSGNRGIWTRDIKISSNIPQHTLTKTLKTLEQRLLVKSVRSVISKSKKLYMLYDVIPSKDITGGSWYTNQEFDHEFVEALSNFIVHFVKSQSMADVNSISERVRISGIANVELSTEEIELVLQTLIYDGRLEEVQKSVLMLTGKASGGQTMYKISRNNTYMNHLTDTPCGICPVIRQCSDGGVISPTTCQYMSEWLKSSYKDDDITNW